MRWRHFHETERREGVESFCHGDIQGTPARGQIVDDLIGAHDDERMRPSAGFAAYENGAHCEMRGFTGPKRLLDRGQIFVAVMHGLFVCLLWRQVGFEYVAAIEFGGFSLRVLIDRQGDGALLDGQLDPVREAQLVCLCNELLQSPLDVGPRMVGEVLVLLGDVRLERDQFRVPGVPNFLGTDRIPPQHVADTLIRKHLSHLLIEEVHLQGPGAQQSFNLGFGNGRNVMEPLLGEVFDLLAFDHARSPTKVISVTPNRALTLLICAAKVCGSCVLPGKTSIETGWPSSSQSKPRTIWRLPFLPSRL